MITWGSPAVPTMRAAVIMKTSSVDLVPDVYSAKPSSRCSPFSRSSRTDPEAWSTPPRPNCGIAWPVMSSDRKIAGTMYAKISTQYCATCV